MVFKWIKNRHYRAIKKQIQDYPKAYEFNEKRIESARKHNEITQEQAQELLELSERLGPYKLERAAKIAKIDYSYAEHAYNAPKYHKELSKGVKGVWGFEFDTYFPYVENYLDQLEEKAKKLGLPNFINFRRHLSRVNYLSSKKSKFIRKYYPLCVSCLEQYLGIGNVIFLEEWDNFVTSRIKWRTLSAGVRSLYLTVERTFVGDFSPDREFAVLLSRQDVPSTFLIVLSQVKVGSLVQEVVGLYKSKNKEVNRAVSRGIIYAIADEDKIFIYEGGTGKSPTETLAKVYKALVREDLPAKVYSKIADIINKERGRQDDYFAGGDLTEKEVRDKNNNLLPAFTKDIIDNVSQLKKDGVTYVDKAAKKIFGSSRKAL